MKKIKDPLILGAVAGLMGNSVKLAGNLINRHIFGFSGTTYPEISAGLFMTKKERKKKTGLAVGTLGDFTIGAMLGVPIVYMLRYTGRDLAALKGLGVGHFAWIALYGTVGRGLGENNGVFPLSAETNFSAYINHSWYGLTTAYVASKLGDPSLFPEPTSRRQKLMKGNSADLPHQNTHNFQERSIKNNYSKFP